MASLNHQAPRPQFEVIYPSSGASHGTEVRINGALLRNVVSVQAENQARLDDLVTSRIVVELAGEPVLISVRHHADQPKPVQG